MTTPIEMPSPLPVNAKVFKLSHNQSISPGGGLFLQTIERAEPMWTASYETPPLSDNRDQVFKAFLDQLEGSRGQFLGFDPRRPRPYAYRSISGEPWLANGATPARVVAANYTNGTVSITGLANGAVLTAGDYISWLQGNAWYLARVVQTMTVAASPVVISVRPRMPDFTGQNYLARLNRACCSMRIIGQVEEKDSVDSFPSYKFNAIQFRNRT